MAGITPDQAENWVANLIYGAGSQETKFPVGLYTNSDAPAETDTMGAFAEVSGASYSRAIEQRNTDFTISGSTATGVQVSFTASGESWGDVYGYFIHNATTGVLYHAEAFTDGPYTMNDGSTTKVTPNIEVS